MEKLLIILFIIKVVSKNLEMANSGLRSGSDYQVLFNPKEYLSTYYAKPKEAHPLVKFGLETVHEIYSTGK